LQCVFLMGILSIVWAFLGLQPGGSGGDALGGFVGDGKYLFSSTGVMAGLGCHPSKPAVVPMKCRVRWIPVSVHMIFPDDCSSSSLPRALICGAYAERNEIQRDGRSSRCCGGYVSSIARWPHWVWSEHRLVCSPGPYTANRPFAGGNGPCTSQPRPEMSATGSAP